MSTRQTDLHWCWYTLFLRKNGVRYANFEVIRLFEGHCCLQIPQALCEKGNDTIYINYNNWTLCLFDRLRVGRPNGRNADRNADLEFAEMPTDCIDKNMSDFQDILRGLGSSLGYPVRNMEGIWRSNIGGKGGKVEPLNDASSLRASLFVPIAASAESLWRHDNVLNDDCWLVYWQAARRTVASSDVTSVKITARCVWRVYKPMKSNFPAVRQCSKSRAKCIGSLECCQWIASGSPIRCTNIGIAW